MPYSINHPTLFYPLYSCSIFCLLYSHSTSRWVYSLAHRRSSHYTPWSFYSVSCSCWLKIFISFFYCYSFILPFIQVIKISVLDCRNFKPTHKIWEPIVLITITSFCWSPVFDLCFGKHDDELLLSIVKRLGGGTCVWGEEDYTDGFAGETWRKDVTCKTWV